MTLPAASLPVSHASHQNPTVEPARAEKVALVDVEDLSVSFRTRDGTVAALDRVSFSVARGRTLGMVGESGSGKSVSAYALMHLLGDAAEVSATKMTLAGLDLLTARPDAIQALRGKTVSMIFQNARMALNPIRPIGLQLMDVLRRHRAMIKADAREAAINALAEVRIPDPKRRFDAYPFELSGGMCQRVMIALAFASDPEVLIADEPTTGLDVTTQATIMDLIAEKAAKRAMSTILITHDLALAADHCDDFAVMHAGHVVERCTTATIKSAPVHPYTSLLVRATPTAASSLAELSSIPGNLPDLRSALPSCRFAHRCTFRQPVCDTPLPRVTLSDRHIVACHMPWKDAP
jgi:peptide/nickel transport system ATP-binding protein